MLDTIVPTEIIMVIIPAYETGTPRPPYMLGQADPRMESGSPSEINATYIITRSMEYIKNLLLLIRIYLIRTPFYFI